MRPRMNQEPFMFQLIRELFQQEHEDQHNVKPVTVREFFSAMALITVAFLFTSWAFGTLPF